MSNKIIIAELTALARQLTARPLRRKACGEYHGALEACNECDTLRALEVGQLKRFDFTFYYAHAVLRVPTYSDERGLLIGGRMRRYIREYLAGHCSFAVHRVRQDGRATLLLSHNMHGLRYDQIHPTPGFHSWGGE